MIRFWNSFCKAAPTGFTLLALGLLSACSSNKTDTRGLPKNLPNIALASPSATPSHNLPSYQYPFDSRGNYVSDWAAEGERRGGRSRAATSSDTSSWSSSHGSSASPVRAAPKPVTQTVARKTTTSSSSSSSGGTRTHVVKKGDTLYGLALRYGTTVTKIKAANGLRSDVIGIGKSLRIPR